MIKQLLHSRLIKPVVKGLVRVYLRLYDFKVAWLLSNRRSQKIFAENKPSLNQIQKRIVAELKKTGIAISYLDELFPGENILPLLRSHVKKISHQAKAEFNNKQFLLYLWDLFPALDLENPFIKFSLDRRILDIVNSYLGMYSRFFLFTLNITRPVGRGSEEIGSQLWHRDTNDRKLCKIFIYLNDVDSEAGPFIFIKSSMEGGRWGNLFRQFRLITNEEIKPAIPKEEIKICAGRAGTVIFCDTAGLHKGGYAFSKERIMFTAGYRSPAAIEPDYFKYPPDFSKQMQGKSNLVPQAVSAVSPRPRRLATKLKYLYVRKKA